MKALVLEDFFFSGSKLTGVIVKAGHNQYLP
jgi:hypothetical protein